MMIVLRLGAEEKDASKLTYQRLKKRPAETVEVAAISKRQAVDMDSGSSNPSSPIKVAALQRNSSSRSWDKEKVKPSHPVNDITESTRFLSTGSRLQSHKGNNSLMTYHVIIAFHQNWSR